jgi:hypothetical protein
MKELDCEYMVDERTALAEAQEKNKRECGRSRALVGHDQMGIRPRSGSYVDSQIILGKVSSLVIWQIQGTRQAQTLTCHYKL